MDEAIGAVGAPRVMPVHEQRLTQVRRHRAGTTAFDPGTAEQNRTRGSRSPAWRSSSVRSALGWTSGRGFTPVNRPRLDRSDMHFACVYDPVLPPAAPGPIAMAPPLIAR